MKANQVQLKSGISLNQFLKSYGTEHQCEVVLENTRWPRGFQCKKCSSYEYSHHRRQSRVKIFQCRNCRTQTTLTEGTIFHSTKLPLTIWFQAMYFLSQTKTTYPSLN